MPRTISLNLDQAVRSVVAAEVTRLLGPVSAQLQQQSDVIARLASAFGANLKRGPGRPVKLGRRSAAAAGASQAARACAVADCGRPSRSKGYCAAHYQKFRNLAKSGRLPADWVEDAAPGSVTNVTLPRGRAGAKALAEAKKKSKK